jgi:inhibitor of KinA
MHSASSFKPSPLQINYLGDHALLVSIHSSVSEETMAYIIQITAVCKSLKSSHPWIKDIIPAYQTVTVVFDIATYYLHQTTEPLFVFKKLLLANLEDATPIKNTLKNKIIQVPVCYEQDFGIDLAKMAELKNTTIDEIIQIHSSEIYSVYCLGFMPGFAYMGNLPEKIQMARHPAPRAKVLAGSVGIAGPQTGVYPMDSPGGWQIIGRTPIKIFDPNPAQLALFQTGDRVQFYSIDRKTFDNMKEAAR